VRPRATRYAQQKKAVANRYGVRAFRDTRTDGLTPEVPGDRRGLPREATLAGALEYGLDRLGSTERRSLTAHRGVEYKRRAPRSSGSARIAQRGGPFRATRADTMWEVSATVVVAATHQIRNAPRAKGLVHDHRWRIRVAVRAAKLDETGWVVDFAELTDHLRALVAPYDGKFINEVAPFDDVNPTRENVARVLADALAARLDDARVRVHRVEIWEEDVCSATYIRGSFGA
jgi:6-pyruvoyltetrahydropterin/6-carboxytetrahydropterin synthase